MKLEWECLTKKMKNTLILKSCQDWDGWKQNFREELDIKAQNKKKVNEFWEWFEGIYNQYGRVFYEKHLIWETWKIYQELRKDNDWWIGCCGISGVGKSTMITQILKTLDPTFDYKRIIYDLDEFLWWIDWASNNKKKYIAIQIDEGGNCMSSLESMQKDKREAKIILEQIRQLNLVVGICQQKLKDIMRGARDKLKSLIYISSRGQFRYFKDEPEERKFCLQEVMQAYYRIGIDKAYYMTRPTLKGHFNNFMVLPEEEINEYKKRKGEVLSKRINNLLERQKKEKENEELLNTYFPVRKIMNLFGLKRQSIYDMISRGEVKSTKIGRNTYLDSEYFFNRYNQ